MPYAEHPSVKTPEDRDSKIWRYMDFTKFVALLEYRALHFTNIATLEDQFEGTVTRPTSRQYRSGSGHLAPDEASKQPRMSGLSLDYPQGMKWGARSLLYISAWHLSEHESDAMWKIYLKDCAGVAIQSTVGRMIEAFRDTPQEVTIGAIEYSDYERDDFSAADIFSLAMHKRRNYEHEKELRAIVMCNEGGSGKRVNVDLDAMIQKVYVAPGSKTWFSELLIQMLNRYSLSMQVLKSSLDGSPPD